ncbi:galactose-binding domain-containing protein [Aquimarina rubra]|uniref:T9SS type A sorting domain-containing protein n=1 Tax=Aquimarina rubra TaxID=1920033 RepID=A0ABW5L917_9FLAO
MKNHNQNVFAQFGSRLFDISKPLVLFILLLIASQTATFSQVSFEGSWGVTFPIFGGERLDTEINLNQKDYMSGAQEIVDELPTAGHVITNLSYFAHSHYFNTRANTNVDVANEIHPAMIPSVENDGVAVEAIQLLRNSGKKIILYISTNYLDRATGDLKEGWVNYYTTKFGGNEYLAYRHLIKGFVEAAAGYADGYWLDTTSALRGDGNFGDFVAMIREADPTALIASGGASRLTHNGEDVYVDSDGLNDTNPANYYVKLHDSNDPLPDFTDGHIVPLGQGAPPNSWSYEEFMIPNIMAEPFYTASNGKKVQKHGWFPIRERWHSPQVPIVFNTEEAYRFVRRITDYGGMITFANTNQTPNLGDGRAGHMMSDEMAIMKEINRRLLMNPKVDYVPYTRPEGASLVGETQYIEFPDIPTKHVGDADFIAATATSGLPVSFTSSNNNVAKIVNDKVRIVGPGKTTIRATQAGAGTFTSAVPAERPLVVVGDIKQDQVITFPPFPTIRLGDPDFDPGVTASSGLAVTYASGNTSVATIVNGKIRIVGEGRSYITASQAGNDIYNAAPDRSRVLTVLGDQNNETIGPWNVTELKEVPNWKTSDVDAQDGMIGMLYESIDYLGEKVEVFAYYSTPSGTPPAGGWPAVVYAHGGGGTAFPQVVKYWNDKGYAAISMDLEGQYPNNDPTPNPGPKRDGVWNDYRLPIEEQWYYHAIAQVMKGHSLIASFPEVNASKIGVMGSSWGGTITSTVMGVDNRLAWALPVYGGGFLSESDGHQGDAITSQEEADFVNTYYDGSAYFDNVTFPTLWLNGLNDFHFSLSVNQKSSQAVNGPANLLFVDNFAHGHLTWRNRDEVYRFANAVVNGGTALPQIENISINSNIGYVTASSAIGINSAQLFYTNDGDTIDLNDKSWESINATISGNTISAAIPTNAELIFFAVTDTQGYMATSEYISTLDSIDNGDNLALNGTASQSGTQNGGVAAYAIDGNTNGSFGADSVIAATGPNAWWEVDLGNEFSIDEIHVYNRTDACCIGRLTNFTVSVFDGDGNTTYSKTFTDIPNPLMIIEIPSATGQTVRVQSNEIPTMNLAEVEVYGTSISNTKLVHITKRNAKGYAIDGNWGGDNGQNIYLYSQNPNNENQQWIEIDRGNGYYSYQKKDTNFCMDGGNGGATRQNVYLWTCNENNQNQHWQKVDVGGGAFKLIKRNAPGFALDGASGGSNLQNVGLWNSSSTSQNLHWIITPIESDKDPDVIDTNEVLIYPNPVVDQVNISLDSTDTSRYTISDINGKIILKGMINEGAVSLDINRLERGLYLLKVSNRSKVFTGKIIKK